MRKLLGLIICSALFSACNNDPKTEITDSKTASASTGTDPKDYEFTDSKYCDIAKAGLQNLVSGDIDTWMASFADNAVYRWNNLDSLIGKAAITDYWKKRRADVIDSMSLTSDIWLPIKVNKPLAPGHLTGNYALTWDIVYAKYKTGKSMTQRIHTVFHFNDNDKIDRVLQYLDHAPITAANTK
jgi:ketosteroid isomerase-like protein